MEGARRIAATGPGGELKKGKCLRRGVLLLLEKTETKGNEE